MKFQVFLHLNIGVVEEKIETFKLLHGIDDNAIAPALSIGLCQESVTSGNSCKLVKSSSRYDVRKYSFTQRIWNSPIAHGVNSSSGNSFKNNIDMFWVSQEVYYNFKCDITGTGNRSLCQLVIVMTCDKRRRTKRLPSLRFSTSIRYDRINVMPTCKSQA